MRIGMADWCGRSRLRRYRVESREELWRKSGRIKNISGLQLICSERVNDAERIYGWGEDTEI
jgi:hypothetical protein